MINLDSELVQDYQAECREHLIRIEAELLAIEKGGVQADLELVDGAMRALRQIGERAADLNLPKVRELANQLEEALSMVRARKLDPSPERVRVLLSAVDRLRDLIHNPYGGQQADIAPIVAALTHLSTGLQAASPALPSPKPLRVLLVEDDFASRLLLQTFLARYGECHVAINGVEAVAAFRYALEHGQRYELICMDIMMPEMDGREAVRQIRALEEEHGIRSTIGAKIIMTTAVEDVKEVVRCFHELCDCYLTKPVDLGTLLGHMKSFQLAR